MYTYTTIVNGWMARMDGWMCGWMGGRCTTENVRHIYEDEVYKCEYPQRDLEAKCESEIQFFFLTH